MRFLLKIVVLTTLTFYCSAADEYEDICTEENSDKDENNADDECEEEKKRRGEHSQPLSPLRPFLQVSTKDTPS